MNEIWKPVKEWPYEVSSLGRVRRTAASKGTMPGRVLNPGPNRTGYLRIRLCSNDGSKKMVMVHRLVADAFLGPCPDGEEINHRDGIKANNRPENLEYTSHKENMKHASRHKLFGDRKGEKHGRTRLKDSDVLEIRRRRADGELLKTLSNEFGVSTTQIHLIEKRKNWSHI